MKKKKFLIFKINNQNVGTTSGEDVDYIHANEIKQTLAFEHKVGFDEVTYEVEEIIEPEYCHNLRITDKGILEFRAESTYASFRPTEGLKPTSDINSEEGFQEFLDLITVREYNKALAFA